MFNLDLAILCYATHMPYQLILAVIAFIALLLSLLIAISNIISMALGAPAVSSPRHELWKKFAANDKTLLDLGCGMGNICVAAAPYFRHVYGIEYSPWYYLVSRLRTRHLKNVSIIHGNFFTTKWPQTDYIYAYLFPDLLTKLYPRLKESQAIVLSLSFPINAVKADKVVDNGKKKMYIYRPISV